MNPDPRLIEALRDAGLREYLLSCSSCGLSGMSMLLPGGERITCPRCGEEIQLVEAPVTPPSKRSRLARHHRDISGAFFIASSIMVMLTAFVAVGLGSQFMAVGYGLAWVLMFAAWQLK